MHEIRAIVQSRYKDQPPPLPSPKIRGSDDGNDDEHDNCFTSDRYGAAPRRFIVKATSLVYCLIARRTMIIVGDVVSEIDDRSVFRAILIVRSNANDGGDTEGRT